MPHALIGIDIGTTNTKVVAFSTDGRSLAKISKPTKTFHPKPGWVEYDANQLWETVASLLRKLMAKLPKDVSPAGIAVAGMAETGISMGPQGDVTHPVISWLDRRVTQELKQWKQQVGVERTALITGLPHEHSGRYLETAVDQEQQTNGLRKNKSLVKSSGLLRL